jgi:AhpD family alkylhydroperoxidase
MDRTCDEKPVWTLRTLLGALPSVPGDLLRVAPTLAGRSIGNALRERLMLAVATENRCRYCKAAHSAFGRLSGLSRAEVEAILEDREVEDEAPEPRRSADRGGAQSEGVRVAVAYVRDLARRGFASRDEELRRRLAQHFEPEVIEATARLMNLCNRAGNTLDAGLDRLKGQR